MTIRSTNLPEFANPAPTRGRKAAASQDQAEAPQAAPAPAPPTGADPARTIVDKLITSDAFGDAMMGKLAKGGEVTVQVGEEEIIKIKSNAPSALEKLAVGAQEMIGVASAEVANVIKADPAFAFKEAALGVKTQVYAGLPKDLQVAADIGFLPMLRVVTMALSVKRAVETWKSKESSKMDKFVDSAHIATNAVGLAGAVAPNVPGMGGMAQTLSIVGLTGDVAAFSYHVMDMIKKRSGKYLAEKAARQAAQAQPQQPQVQVQQPVEVKESKAGAA